MILHRCRIIYRHTYIPGVNVRTQGSRVSVLTSELTIYWLYTIVEGWWLRVEGKIPLGHTLRPELGVLSGTRTGMLGEGKTCRSLSPHTYGHTRGVTCVCPCTCLSLGQP